MSRPVKNLRFMGTAGKASDADKGGPKGSQKAYGALTKGNGTDHLGAGKYEQQTTPAFGRPPALLQKYGGKGI